MIKPEIQPIEGLLPNEYLIPKDTWEDIAAHYDGTVESLMRADKPIKIIADGDDWYVADGNKRTAFLVSKGHDYIHAVVYDDPDEVDYCKEQYETCKANGVHTIDDLADNVVSRKEFDERMGV